LPCVAGPKEQEIYKDYPLQKRNYYGCITAMDEQVGRLVKHLKDNGLFDNTLIFFCSDNGPEGNDSAPGTTAGMRGRKRSLYEGGIRVPGFMVWGNKINGGNRTDAPCFTSDYMPTILDIVGIRKSNPHQLDGESIMPLVSGKRPKSERTRPMVFVFQGQAAVVDNQYKLYYLGDKYELYDLRADRSETTDIADKHPKLVERYTAILKEHVANYKCSFSGEEFSVKQLLNQTWTDPFLVSKEKASK
ncbi:MAG: sulfatase-like hydrolase/transferase, partial [Rikenellaceae bacterium]